MIRLSIIAALALSALVAASASDPLAQQFLHPPDSAKPRTFWFWMNGNVTKDGITRDLEAMQRVGIGGVMMFDGSTYLPAGPAGYLDPHWRSLMTHAIQEGNRLGIDIGMHNAPGWSSSGGPWITPEKSMQQLVSTETTIEGGRRVEIALARPHANAGFYADSRVVAFPSLAGEEKRYEDELLRVTTSRAAFIDAAVLSDGQLTTVVQLTQGEPLLFEFKRSITFYALTASPGSDGRFATLQVEASRDGIDFAPVTRVTNPGRHGILAPAVRNFAPVEARFVRVTPSRDGEVAEFVLHRSPRVERWTIKANFDYRATGQMRMPEENPRGMDPRSVLDLTAKLQGDTLVWDAPPGSWTILRIGHTTTGKTNVASSAAGRGLECDKFNPAAAEFHFRHVIERVRADAAAVGAKGPATVTIDSYEAGMQNWTAAFPGEFERRAGYSIVPYLAALFGRIVVDAEVTERFLFDFRRVQADLMAENYYGKLAELTRANGMKFYVEGYGVGPFDELRVAGVPDVPMTEFWTRTPWTPNRPVKMVTSAGHIYGKSIIGAESFTGETQTSRWLDYPYALKILGDDMFAQGVNQLVFHRYAHQPHPDAVPGMAMGPYGFHFDRTNTWFEFARPWLKYIARTQNILRNGNYVADVLYYTGERAPDPSQMAMPVLPVGYTYDLVNTDVILNRLTVEEGQLAIPGGGRYRLLALPPDLEAMRPELAQRLREFVEAGATVLGPRPKFSPTLRNFPASERGMLSDARFLWGDAKKCAEGRGLTGMSIADALREIGVAPDFTFVGERPDAAISWQHRKLADGELYFVANRQRRVETIVGSFRGQAGRQPEIWRTETGTIEEAVLYRNEGDRALVPLRLEPAESVFVFFRKPARASTASLRKDGEPVLTTALVPGRPVDVSRTFTMSIWVKPDTDLRALPKESASGRIDEVGKFYAIPADPGDVRFGPGHATAGLAVGRNGIFVVERSSESSPAVLVARLPVAGWTHVAVVYREGKPSLYVNGKFVREGLESGKIVHSGVGSPPPPVDYVLHFAGIESLMRSGNQEVPPSRGNAYYFEGNSVPPEVVAEALDEGELQRMADAGPPSLPLPVVSRLTRGMDGARGLVWETGVYSLGGGREVQVKVPAPLQLSEDWQVRFQPGRGAPERIELPRLTSLHRHEEDGVKYFSGTATYEKSVRIPAGFIADDRRVILDLGRVEVIAEVKVNHRTAGIVWKEPYRLDVTELVQSGENRLEISVANLWPNRLIGDEHLPPEDEFGIRNEQGDDPHGITRLPQWYLEGKPKPPGGRVTFATWRFYDKDEPLLASGLLGPVVMASPIKVRLE